MINPPSHSDLTSIRAEWCKSWTSIRTDSCQFADMYSCAFEFYSCSFVVKSHGTVNAIGITMHPNMIDTTYVHRLTIVYR